MPGHEKALKTPLYHPFLASRLAAKRLPDSRLDINTLNLKCLFYTRETGSIERMPNDRK